MDECPRGGLRCPRGVCDCFIDTHPHDAAGLHPEAYVVVEQDEDEA